MKTATLNVMLADEAPALERLFGTMRRRCVPLESARIVRAGDGLLVSIVMEQHLEPTARALLARVPEVRQVIDPPADNFWSQFQ